jgi:hypothetical protein
MSKLFLTRLMEVESAGSGVSAHKLVGLGVPVPESLPCRSGGVGKGQSRVLTPIMTTTSSLCLPSVLRAIEGVVVDGDQALERQKGLSRQLSSLIKKQLLYICSQPAASGLSATALFK